jgi:DNA-directed RNA polymerase specialized sigma24 family protein
MSILTEMPQDGEDLVQETFANVPGRRRLPRTGNELDYLQRALKNTHALGDSYSEAARSLDTSKAKLTTRLRRGRQHVAHQLVDETTSGV